MTNVAMEYSDPTFTSMLGWQSPRISFCHDIPGDRVSPEKRKREEIIDNYSTEFEFCMVQNATNPTFLDQGMISADELFLDGKLLPLHIPPQTPLQEMDDATPEDLENTTHAVSAEPEPEVKAETQSINVVQDVSLENVQSSADSGSNTIPVSPKSPKLSHRWKEIFKLGKLQVVTSKDSECQEIKKGEKKESHNHGFSLKQPLSPRSIWPFTRSSSAGDAKAASTSCSLASSRSNSAGDSNYKPKVSSAPCSRSNSGSDSKSKVRSAISSKIHMDFITKPVKNSSLSSSLSFHTDPTELVDPRIAPAQQEAFPCPSTNPAMASTIEETQKCVDTIPKLPSTCDAIPLHQTAAKSIKKRNGHVVAKEKRSPNKSSTDGVPGSTPMRSKGCASPGRPLRMRSPSGNYGRGSPVRIIGRSAACNGSPARVGSGKFMIKNLERCTANSKNSVKSQDSMWPGRQKEGFKMSDKTNSYSTGVRVLNVPVCIGHARVGKASNNRLFNLRGLFSKKEK
jgi:hypothetical protein